MKSVLMIALFLLAPQPAPLGQTQQVSEQQKIEARDEINEGAAAYKGRRYEEARQHFERARAIDPTLKIATFFIARAIHSQYKPGGELPENVAKAREAIGAYQEYLQLEPDSDEAYNAIVYLFRSIKDEEQEAEWLTRRATDASAPAEKRSLAYVVLASKEWQCSYDITGQWAKRRAVAPRGRAAAEHSKSKEQGEYDKARRCAERGMDLIEQAISLDSDSEQAWSYKTHLLFEMIRLAYWEGDSDRSDAYKEQSAQAQQRMHELKEQNKKKPATEEEKRLKESQEKLDPPK